MRIIRFGIYETPEFVELVISELMKLLNDREVDDYFGDICKMVSKKLNSQMRYTHKQVSCTFWMSNNQPIAKDTVKYVLTKKLSKWVIQKDE